MKVQKNKPISYLPLIDEWEKFLTESNTDSLEHFAVWLLREKQNERTKTNAFQNKEMAAYFDQKNEENNYSFLSSEASFLLWKLNKYLRFYTKNLFAETGLNSQDEFAILAHIDNKKVCTKKVAIEENLIDLTTGTEIIKRLVKKKLLNEKLNPADKREKLVSITPQGGLILGSIYQGFSQIQDVLANLDVTEREILVGFLKNLDSFHSKNIKGGE